MAHMLEQNKGAHTECETGRDVPYEVASPAQAAKGFHLSWEGSFQAQGRSYEDE